MKSKNKNEKIWTSLQLYATKGADKRKGLLSHTCRGEIGVILGTKLDGGQLGLSGGVLLCRSRQRSRFSLDALLCQRVLVVQTDSSRHFSFVKRQRRSERERKRKEIESETEDERKLRATTKRMKETYVDNKRK